MYVKALLHYMLTSLLPESLKNINNEIMVVAVRMDGSGMVTAFCSIAKG
jgi:hypothetical protein